VRKKTAIERDACSAPLAPVLFNSSLGFRPTWISTLFFFSLETVNTLKKYNKLRVNRRLLERTCATAAAAPRSKGNVGCKAAWRRWLLLLRLLPSLLVLLPRPCPALEAAVEAAA
jgi:hypothetical protein